MLLTEHYFPVVLFIMLYKVVSTIYWVCGWKSEIQPMGVFPVNVILFITLYTVTVRPVHKITRRSQLAKTIFNTLTFLLIHLEKFYEYDRSLNIAYQQIVSKEKYIYRRAWSRDSPSTLWNRAERLLLISIPKEEFLLRNCNTPTKNRKTLIFSIANTSQHSTWLQC